MLLERIWRDDFQRVRWIRGAYSKTIRATGQAGFGMDRRGTRSDEEERDRDAAVDW
jgi:hypothetical protein